MQQTPNYALKKIELTDSPPDITTINPNWDTIDTKLKENADALVTHQAETTSHVQYSVATGTANTYAVSLNPAPTAYVEGMAVSVKINVDSTGASTLNVNALGAKGIKKANGTDVTNLKANGIYTMRYDGVNFILQGEGGSGNALASDLLSGKTASTDAGDIVGTMPNNGVFNLGFGASVPAGYYSGGTVPNGKKWATGLTSCDSNGKLTVTGLTFKPSFIFAYVDDSNKLNHMWYYSVANASRSVFTHTYPNPDGTGTTSEVTVSTNSFSMASNVYFANKSMRWIVVE